MRIKKKDYNEYLLLDNIWIRNFVTDAPPVDQNIDMFTPKDLELCLENETQNHKMKWSQISAEHVAYENIAIVSDGHDFVKKRETLMSLPRTVAILGTNGVLNRWITNRHGRPMTHYVVNNPYAECAKFLPRETNYFPPCIASVRTNSSFLSKYSHNGGTIHFYTPTANKRYSGLDHGATQYVIDDYRNPICAAISIAYRFKARKLLLFCHDDCFDDKRPAAVPVENGLWTYPPQHTSNEIIDAHLGWLKNTDIGYHADGLKLTNAEYIPFEQVTKFFEEHS